jgi:hypothetical protein
VRAYLPTWKSRENLCSGKLDAVYIYNKHAKSIVAVKPKPPFKPVFQIEASREGAYIRIINEPLAGLSLFLVKTEESRSPSYPPIFHLAKERRAFKVIFQIGYQGIVFKHVHLITYISYHR